MLASALHSIMPLGVNLRPPDDPLLAVLAAS
jgi:hypothetical protein